MGLGRSKLFVAKIGEWAVKSGATFYAGGPLQITAIGGETESGSELGECSDYRKYIGAAIQDSADTTANGKVAFYTGTSILTLKASVINSTSYYPFDHARCYYPGDLIFIDEGLKKWTNDPIKGITRTNLETAFDEDMPVVLSGAEHGKVLESDNVNHTVTILFNP